MSITKLKTGSHGIILNIEDARKDYLTNSKNLTYSHGLSRQCCEYVSSVWTETPLLFVYPVAYLAKQYKNPDEIVEEWMKFLKETPFAINYKGKMTAENLPATVNTNLREYLEHKNHKNIGGTYVYDKKDFQEFYAFTIDRNVILPKYNKYALACFSMIRNLFIDDYRGYVQKCFDLKKSAPNADNFHIIQLAFLHYDNVSSYCEGSYNLLYVESNDGPEGAWYWTLTDKDTFIKNITMKSFASINMSFDAGYVKASHNNRLAEYNYKDVHTTPLKQVIINAIKKNDFETAFNNVKKYEEK